MTVDRVGFAANFPQGGKSDRFSGEFENWRPMISTRTPRIAMLDRPGKR